MIIIEGADCTGKTTLAKAICEYVHGQYFHCSYHESWNIEAYHRLILHTAGKLEELAKIPCVIDRWALSEAAYGLTYRGAASYDTAALAKEAIKAYKPTFILCRTDDAIGTHNRLKQERREMYKNIQPVLGAFDLLAQQGKHGTYILFDYQKHDLERFVEAFAKRRADV